MEKVKSILLKIARQYIPEYGWLEEQIHPSETFIPGDFYLSFNLIHRKIPDRPIEFTSEDVLTLKGLYPGFKADYWGTRSLARTLLVLTVEDEHRRKVLDNLFATADIQELELLYRLLYWLPDPGNYAYRGAEGIRTNMTSVFDALALDNPFPSEYLDEGAWNQMVLKAIFMQRPLYRIVGLDERHNENLARIATDFAHERWAASRTVTPELWRLLTGFKTDQRFEDIQRVCSSDMVLEQEAGKRVLNAWNNEKHPTDNVMSWDEIGIKLEENELY